MDSKQTRIIYIVFIFIFAAWLVSALLFSAGARALPVSRAPLSFDASAAYQIARDFVTQFPQRVLGSLESRQSTGYIQDHLENLGYSRSYTHFDARITGRTQVGRNILAYKQGQTQEILAVVAHLDTARTTTQGAMDNGSGVAVLLELARVFAASPTYRSLLLVFTDGGEWGSLGARDVAANYPDRDRIAAVLSLDSVGIGDLEALSLEETGQLKGFSPPWLRQLARKAIESVGLPVQSSSGFSEFLDRAFLISWADQGPFLSQGIPAINLGSASKDRRRQQEIYHSAQDTIENLKPASIGAYGLAAERIVRSLDELPSIWKAAPDGLRVWGARYLPSGIVQALQILSFLPLAIAFCFCWNNHGRKLTKIGAGREFLAFLGTLLPLWIIFFLIQLARALRLLPVYTLYPATIKDPVLESPAWGVLAGIFGAALFAAIVCYVIAKYSSRDLPKPDFQVSRLMLLALLGIVVALSLAYNSYWASLFLILPAWIWPLAGRTRSAGIQTMNRSLILASGIVYYAVLWSFASGLSMGWNFIWYQVLALANGLFTRSAFFLATAVIAIGIRFLAIQSRETKSYTERHK
jgi:hypothetical protein